jgi:threonine dehydratase
VLENVRAIRELVDDVRLVSEGQLFGAIRHLLKNEKVLAEPAGAATTAAWLAQPANTGNVALVVSGGNITENIMREVSEG